MLYFYGICSTFGEYPILIGPMHLKKNAQDQVYRGNCEKNTNKFYDDIILKQIIFCKSNVIRWLESKVLMNAL